KEKRGGKGEGVVVRWGWKRKYKIIVFFFKKKTACEIRPGLVGSEVYIRDSPSGVILNNDI
ncbi:hypothetical protein QO221_23105, partial [Vibrio vulnificus]|uniref:hypothetical protein n=1 Tax=Vibrio vulnificus TaxID=672 RepID=UPI0024DF6FF9